MQPASYYVVGHLWFSFCHRSPCFEIGRPLAAARAGFRHEIPSGLFFFVQEKSRCKQDQLQDSAQMVPRQIKYMLWNSTFVDSYLLLLIFPSKRLGWSSIYGLQLAPQENRDFIFNSQLDWGIRIATWFTTCNIRTKIAEVIRLLSEEDMLGHLTKLASACHGATVVKRFFQRFGLFLSLHWDNITRRAANWFGSELPGWHAARIGAAATGCAQNGSALIWRIQWMCILNSKWPIKIHGGRISPA